MAMSFFFLSPFAFHLEDRLMNMDYWLLLQGGIVQSFLGTAAFSWSVVSPTEF
jgi:hypothetical protein